MSGAAAPLPARPPVRVLVVDDSATVRAVLSRSLGADPGIEVVGVARDGVEALERAAELQPDVVTLDIEMPRMGGLETLERLMAARPTAVVMVSSHTTEGADATIRALELGAVDFIAKPEYAGIAAPHRIGAVLRDKVKQAAEARVTPVPTLSARRLDRVSPPAEPRARARTVVVIGTSTGGPQALHSVLPALPADLDAAVLVVQHMPPGFTASLAHRLDEISPLAVKEAAEGDRVCPRRVLIAPGGYHMTVTPDHEIHLTQEATECGVRPSVNVTLASAAGVFGSRTLGVILTGMGSDGTRGARAVREAGGRIIAEAESSCVVYGMPRSVAQAGLVDRVVSLPFVAMAVSRACREMR